MARLWYRPSAAEFVIGLGAETELLDAAGASLDPPRMGRTAAVPLTSDSYSVYTAPDSGSVTTDLLDEASEPITQWTTSEEFATLGRGPAFQGPDGHEGDVFLSGDGVTFYRVTPDTGTVFGRLTALEEAPPSVSELGDLDDVDITNRADGRFLGFNNSTGQNEYFDPAGTGTVTSVASVAPVSGGNVPTAALLAALSLSTAATDLATIKSNTWIVRLDTGSGYPAKPSGFPRAAFLGATQPTTGVADGDIWLQPASE